MRVKPRLLKKFFYSETRFKSGYRKGRGSNQHAKSDWMEMEKERGISVTTSVMQFPYNDCLVNLLDTPGHEDFSEDTYRTLTAVDSCLMVIDAAKGVEDRTRKLMEVTRLRDTPIVTFMNKLDRDVRDPMEVLDEVESELGMACAQSLGLSVVVKSLKAFTTFTVMKRSCMNLATAMRSKKFASSKV